MSFFKSIFYGVKLYFFISLAIGLSFFIDIQRNDLEGNLEASLNYIQDSIDILTLVFPLFCFYIGSKQSNLIKRKTDSGFAAAISAGIGFLMITYMNWGITYGSLLIADAIEIIENNENLLNFKSINDLIWRIIPAILAGLFAAIINNNNEKMIQLESKKSVKNEIDDSSPTPWVYSVGVVDEHGFEWIKHNNKQWYRAANSGNEWKEYS
tara:strand:- start:231 stop:860 length:630 start_codon:yes stop_codon:yes gene_type:complete